MNYSSENPAGIRNSVKGDTLDGKPILRLATAPNFPKAAVSVLNTDESGQPESADVGVLNLEEGGFDVRDTAPHPMIEQLMFASVAQELSAQMN